MNTFVLTSDCDHLLGDEHINILRKFADHGIFITTAVFNYVVSDESWLGQHCSPIDTTGWVDNLDFQRGLMEAKAMGHEIAFHGASQVSNTREEFLKGLDEYNTLFGEYPFTYVEHGPNPKHHVGLGYKEELLNQDVDENSPYYIKDIIEEVFTLTWTQDQLLSSISLPRKPDNWFYSSNGVTYFSRCRMSEYNPETLFKKEIDGGSAFVGYTHFGYEGYFGNRRRMLLRLFRKQFPSRFEFWKNENLLRNIWEFKQIEREFSVHSMTLREFYLHVKSHNRHW